MRIVFDVVDIKSPNEKAEFNKSEKLHFEKKQN